MVLGKIFSITHRSVLNYLVTIGEIADFFIWITLKFEEKKFFATRELLLSEIDSRFEPNRYQVVELGVAHGFLTNWFLRKHPRVETWLGFDTFNGLPRQWRKFPKGAFNANGQAPKIVNSKIKWFIGDVSTEIKKVEINQALSTLIIFDLDIFEPSFEAWQQLKNFLKPGDILYFDEAFDKDERKLLNEFVLNTFKFNLVGHTSTGLAIRVVSD